MENQLDIELDLNMTENSSQDDQLDLMQQDKEKEDEVTLENTSSIEDKYTVFTTKQAEELQVKQKEELDKTLDETLKYIAQIRMTQKWNLNVTLVNREMQKCENTYERLEKDNLAIYSRETRERQMLINQFHNEHHPKIVYFDKVCKARYAEYQKQFTANLKHYKQLQLIKSGKDLFIKSNTQKLYEQLKRADIKLITDLDLAGTDIDNVILPSLTSASFTCAKCGETVKLSTKTDNIYNPTNTLLLLVENTYKLGNLVINLYDFASRLVIPFNICRKCGQIHVFPVMTYKRAQKIFKHDTDIIHNYHLDKKTQCASLHKSRNKNDEVKESDKLILQSLANDYMVSILINSFCYDGILKFKVKGKEEEVIQPKSLKNVHTFKYTPRKSKEISSYERLSTKVNDYCNLDDVKSMSLDDIESLDFTVDDTTDNVDLNSTNHVATISEDALSKALNQQDIENMNRSLIEIEDDIAYEQYTNKDINELSEDELLAPYKFFNDHMLKLRYLNEDLDGEICETSTLDDVVYTIRQILNSGNESFLKDLRILPDLIKEELSLYNRDEESDFDGTLVDGVIDLQDLQNQETENSEIMNLGDVYED